MIVSASRPLVLGLSIAAALTVTAASAETIAPKAPRQAAAAEAASTAPSSLPYSCAKSELNTRLQKKACL